MSIKKEDCILILMLDHNENKFLVRELINSGKKVRLAINDLKYAYVLISFTLVEIGLISFIPQSIFEMVIVMLIINAILFFISYTYVIRGKILSLFNR